MRLFSRLLKWLMGDQEHHRKEMEMIRDKTSEEISAGTESKEIKAKVAYQYPQGKFRFPVIPDEEIRDRTRQKRTEKSDQWIKEGKKQFRHKRYDHHEQSSMNRSSFRPTEIPSPIYGFGPRNESSYRQEVFSKNDVNNKEVKEPQINEYDEKEFARIQKDEKAHPIDVDPHCVHKENVHFAQEEVNIHSTEKLDEERQFVHDENKEGMQEKEYEVGSHFLTESVHQGTMENEIPLSPSDQDEVKESFDNIEENEDEFEANKKEVKDEEQELGCQLETNEQTRVKDVKEREDQKDNTSEQNDRKEEMSKEKQTTSRTNEKRSTTIPYNVLMFGRDKRKLQQKEQHGYVFPDLSLLKMPPEESFSDHEWINEQKELLNLTLKNFNVRAKVVNVTQGPSVTRLEVHPEPGVKVSKITNLIDDIKLSLSARDIRIEAPIPGKNTIGIEVPNKKSKMVYIREILRSPQFRQNPSSLTVALGLDISGQPIVTDLKKMPHGLIAGATGSGKSVCINTMLISLLYKASPHEIKLLLIDPKMVELAPYNDIPHLVSPVITDVKAATASLKWAVEEMERRYELFAHTGVRDISKYNENVKKYHQGEKLPYIVIVIDELADLMMAAPGDVEEAICRIAQKARACGIHLLIATQRPSVDVITGLIKANIPTRIAFAVSSQVDSRTIIDTAGAERLLGKGDMLFLENGSSKPLRVQGNFVSDEEIERVVEHVRQQAKPQYLFKQEELIKKADIQSEEDELFYEACEFVIEQGGASTSSLQRRFRIGYNRAARLIDLMEEQGIISESKGSKPRDVLVTEEDFAALKQSSIHS